MRATLLKARLRRLDRATVALLALVALGAVLRLVLVLAYRPAFLGYPDSGFRYAHAASTRLFADQWHVAGYAFFLRAIHVLPNALPLTILVQHGLGIATAALLFATVRRLGGSAWLAIVPAALVLLSADQVFFEHALLSEPLFTPLVAASVYAAVRSLDGDGSRWLVLAGLAVGLASLVRSSGLALLPVLAGWILFVPAVRRRALRAGIAAGAGGAVVLVYLVVAHAQTGEWSLSPRNVFNSYARVATFADCTEFRPPAGTSWLCDPTPPAKRGDPHYYIFVGGPLIRRYRLAELVPRSAVNDLKRFTRAAQIHQPLDWVHDAARDFTSYVSPRKQSEFQSFDGYERLLTSPLLTEASLTFISPYYGHTAIVERHGLLNRLRDYERATRVEGAFMVALLLLAAVAPFACRGRLRLGAIVLAGYAYTLLVVPVMAIEYDARYAVPAYGLLGAAAALGVHGIVSRVRERRASDAHELEDGAGAT